MGKRLCRILIHFVPIVSLILCLASGVLWWRSYNHDYLLMRRVAEPNGNQRELTITIFRGSFRVAIGETTGTITEQRLPATYDGYWQLTGNWRFLWADNTQHHPVNAFATNDLGFGQNTHVFWAVEPPNVGTWGTFSARHARQGTRTIYMMPPLLWVVLFAFLPAVSLLKIVRRLRIAKGHCLSCGYNLTGNTSGRCPECGADSLATS